MHHREDRHHLRCQQRATKTTRRLTLLTYWAVVALSIVSLPLCVVAQQQPSHDDIMNEVLEEAEHYQDEHTMEDEDVDEYQRRIAEQEEMQRLQQEEEERRARESIQRQREEAFQAELRQMNEEARKEALAQQRKDAKIVRRILRAAEKGNHYGVLGLYNINLRIPKRTIKIAGLVEWTTPELSLYHVSARAIRRAYRGLAKAVHPDKNRDARAVEAFVAVENAASILSDEKMRAEYDLAVRKARQERNQHAKRVVGKAVHGTVNVANRAFTAFRTVLGPFALPVLIIGSILV